MNPDIQNVLSKEEQAIKNCESIPIQFINHIQPFGALIAVDIDSKVVVNASENITNWVDLPVNKVLGANMADILPKEIVHQIKNSLCHSTIETLREYVGRLAINNKTCEIYTHTKSDRIIIEFQKIFLDTSDKPKILGNVQRIISRLDESKSVLELYEHVVIELREFTGFDRVMAYHFLNDGAGEVVAEARDPQISPFLGLRFPAADIPQSARKLYTTTPIRIIPSIIAEQVKILSLEEEQAPLDMSLALFRGVIPVHSMYLQNMGVAATLGLPIVISDELKGLFAFHHNSEKLLDSEVLSGLCMISKSIALIKYSLLHDSEIQTISDCNRVASSLFVPDDSALGFSAYWDVAGSELSTLIDSDGVALLSDDRYDTYGACLSKTEMHRLAEKLDELPELQVVGAPPFGIDSFEQMFPDCDLPDHIVGALIIPQPALSYNYLIYFRKKEENVIRWAGNPAKNIEEDFQGIRLNPRASFEEYQEQTRSQNFSYNDLLIAKALSSALRETISNAITHTHHKDRLGLVIRELNHRVRNILSLIGSIIAQSKGSANNISEFANTLELRLQALSETQKLLTEYNWKQVNIHALINHSLVAYNNYLGSRIVIHGSQVSIHPSLATILALITNELASNALKYGALSNAEGVISISWTYDNEVLHLHWKESNGPTVVQPKRRGFGTTLIKEALAYEFNADCELTFEPTGAEVNFSIPLKDADAAQDNNSANATITAQAEKLKFTALVLEDDYIISREMVDQLTKLGATKIDAVPSIQAAKDCIKNNDYDIAFLDVNIRGNFTVEVARKLELEGIPYAFSTGYGSKAQEIKNLASLATLSKPVSRLKLLSVLKKANI